MSLAFFGNWDATALGTLALAGSTLAAVIVAAVSLRQTRKAIALSRREVEEAHRPVIVPIVYARSASLAERLTPEVIDDSVLAIPIKNIGSGPALNIVAFVARLNEGPTARERRTPGIIAGLGNEAVVPIELSAHGWEERWDFELTIHYEDLAAKHWETICHYVASLRRYEDVTVHEQQA